MDFHLLNEARKRSTRHRENQRARTQYLGREAKTVGALGWRKRIVYIMRELRMSPGMQRLAMTALGQLEKKHGAHYLNNLPTESLTFVLKAFKANFYKYKNILPREHRRPGVSGVYHTAGTARTRAGIERSQAIRQADADAQRKLDIELGLARGPATPEPEVTPGKPASSKQLRMDIAHLTTQDMSKRELAAHPHPAVRHLYGAIRQDKAKFQRDRAVVWTADDKPFYILGQLTKPLHRAAGAKGEFDILLPRSMDHRGRQRKIRLAHLGDYTAWTKWRTMMRTKDMVKLDTIKGVTNFGQVIKKAQQMAWGHAKDFYETYKNYRAGMEVVTGFRKLYRRPDGGHRKMSSEHQKVHDASWHYMKAHEDKILGKMPKVKFDDEKVEKAIKESTTMLGDSYTWYLWLLASEQQYGIRLPERKQAPENKKLPTGKNPVQAKPEHWTIQPVGREEVPRWDATVLKGIGFSPADFRSFEVALEKSNYKLGLQGNKALTHLWVPMVDKLGGVKALPSDISDYLADAKTYPKTGYVVGREGGKIVVRKDLPLKQYFFQAGSPRKTYSLISAVGYLQHFDSPKHGGVRLVHGQARLQAPPKPVHTTTDRPWSSQMRSRSQSWRTKRGRVAQGYHPEQTRKQREQAAGRVAEKLLAQARQAEERRAAFEKRKLQRAGIPAWKAPKRPTPGTFVRVPRMVPRSKLGLQQDITGRWEYPEQGEIMGSRIDPRTGQRIRVRRQPQRKKYVIRGTGVRSARPRRSVVHPNVWLTKRKKSEG